MSHSTVIIFLIFFQSFQRFASSRGRDVVHAGGWKNGGLWPRNLSSQGRSVRVSHHWILEQVWHWLTKFSFDHNRTIQVQMLPWDPALTASLSSTKASVRLFYTGEPSRMIAIIPKELKSDLLLRMGEKKVWHPHNSIWKTEFCGTAYLEAILG